jgi:hypothetical protein
MPHAARRPVRRPQRTWVVQVLLRQAPYNGSMSIDVGGALFALAVVVVTEWWRYAHRRQ